MGSIENPTAERSGLDQDEVNDLMHDIEAVMQKQLTVFGTGFGKQLNDRFTELDERLDVSFGEIRSSTKKHGLRLDRVDQRFDHIEARFNGMEGRFDEMDNRFDKLENRFGQIDDRFDTMDERFGQIDTRLGKIDDRLGRVDARLGKLDQRLGRVEPRLVELRDGLGELQETQANQQIMLEKILAKLN